MCENILVLSEDEENIKYIKSKLLLLRSSDKVGALPLSKLRKSLETQSYEIVLIDESQYNRETILKAIETVKSFSDCIEVVIINSDETDDFMSQCYDKGAYSYIKIDAQKYEYMMVILNSFKMNSLKEQNSILKAFLSNTSSVIPKNDLITHKALKEAFYTLQQNQKIRNGIFAVLTLEEKTKTKVSLNRLSGILKKFLRETDIIASALGYFYIVFENVDLEGAKSVIEKISEKMGEDFEIRAGLAKIGKKEYESIEKQAKDSLKSAINNEEVCVALGTNVLFDNSEWLSDDGKSKHYKLFQIAFDKKLKTVIEPSFFRFEKECLTKIPDCTVNQYANRIECNFTLKKDNTRSELLLRHDGFAKIKLKIVHYGLDSTENTDLEINLNTFGERELNKYLKQLKNEFLEAKRNA